MTTGTMASVARRLAMIAAIAASVFLVAWAGVLLTRQNGRIASVWLANAVAVAILLRSPKQRWPELVAAVLAANFAANLANGDALLRGLVLSMLNAFEVLVVALPMQRRFGSGLSLGEVRPLGHFLLFAGLIAPLLSASGAALYLGISDGVAMAPLFKQWFLADALGLLTLTPLLLAIPRQLDFRLPARALLEPALILAITVVVTSIVYTQSASIQAWVIPCLLLAAFRMPAGGAALATAVVAAEAVLLTSIGSGPIAASPVDPSDRMLLLQSFIAVVVFITLPVSAVISERNLLLKAATLARDEAHAAAHAKSNFLATMSHEIRTPMTGVLGMIELLRADLPEDERERYFSTLKQSATLLMTVLDDVLDFSKIESGNLSLASTDFDFEELAQSTLDLFTNAASQKGLLIAMHFDGSHGGIVRGDPVRLQQVMSNLISNAIKFTERGRVTIDIRPTAIGADQLNWRVEVRDTGIGIADQDLDRLFQPFVQADHSTSRRFGGTGLGLAISRWVIEAMDGKIGIESAPGRGSTFWFEVPLEQSDAADWRAPAVDLPISQRRLDILVAEDNPVNQMLIGAILRRLGHKAILVENGRMAVEAALDQRFDCILMDMQMPEMDGLAATRAIRASLGPCAAVPIFALTADASPERRRFYDNAGLTGFMTKPIDRHALATRLAAIGNGTAAAADASPPDATAEVPLFDYIHINQISVAIGATRFEGLLALLAKELVERPAIIRRAVLAGDIARARNEAHSLKGATMSVGAMALGQAAAIIELAPDLAAMIAALAILDRQAERTRKAIATLLPRFLPTREAS